MNKTTFQSQIKTLWSDIKNNDDLLKADAKDLFAYNKMLLEGVIKRHQDEKEHGLENIIQDINTKSLYKKVNGTFSYHDLYFCDEDHDYYFVGDIHSDAFVLEHLLDTCDFFEKVDAGLPFKLVFLGDYVDRGKHHFKTLQIILMLKYYFPENILLLMGNHDIGKIEDGQVTLYLKKMEEDMDYFYIYMNHLHQHHPDFTDQHLDLYITFMNTLNVAAFIITKEAAIKAVHGGIARPLDEGFDYLRTYKQLTDETIDHASHRVRDSLLWSDPSIQDNKKTIPGKRFKFYENQLINYLDRLNIDIIIRGHQAVEEGHLHLFDKIHTIFSSGKILKDGENINVDTAYDFIPPKLLHYNHQTGLPLHVLDIKLRDNQ